MKDNGKKSANGPCLHIYEKSTLPIDDVLVLFLITSPASGSEVHVL